MDAGFPQYLTINDVAGITRFSRRTIVRLFENEPDVVVIDRPEARNKKRYRTYRIPESALNRVLTRYRVKQ
jgi:hypothetical protein